MEFIKDNFLYYVLAVFLVYIIIKIWGWGKRRRQSKEEVFFDATPTNKWTEEQKEKYRWMALGALFAQQQNITINNLSTGWQATECRETLSDSWSIEDEQSAKETLEYLLNKGYNFYFPVVSQACFLTDEASEQLIESSFEDEEGREQAFSQVENFKDTAGSLMNAHVIESPEDIKKYGVLGWDLGRVVLVCRICYDSGYITEPDAISYIRRANEKARKVFSNWEDFSKSYIIGRALWGGRYYYDDNLPAIARNLLKSPKSPWILFNW